MTWISLSEPNPELEAACPRIAKYLKRFVNENKGIFEACLDIENSRVRVCTFIPQSDFNPVRKMIPTNILIEWENHEQLMFIVEGIMRMLINYTDNIIDQLKKAKKE